MYLNEGLTFYYDAIILREGRRIHRQGTLKAASAVKASDEITRMSVENWKKPLLNIDIYEVGEGGELKAVLNAVVGEDYAKKRVKELRNKQTVNAPRDSHAPETITAYKDTSYWSPSSVGTYMTSRTFVTFTFKERGAI